MKIIDPDFQYDGQPNLSDQTFLNDFVCLYTKFFDNYEDKFQFKVKVRNLLRPTNVHSSFIQHNILNDMVKYLADFSRDYSQHVYLWQMKQTKKQQEIAEQSQKRLSISNNSQSVIYQSGNSNQNSKQRPMQSFRNSVNIGHIGEGSFKKLAEDNENQMSARKMQFNKNYGILDIQPLPNFVFIDKIKGNVDVLRLKMNQLYRDAKFRNNMVKSSVSLYFNAYQSKYNPAALSTHTSKQNLIEDSHPHIFHPYRVSLVIERNGFSCINITAHDHQRNLSPMKQKIRLSSLSNRDSGLSQIASKTVKNQFVLNSLKVLRVSENFLPPLIGRKQSTRVNSEQQMNKQQHLLKKLSYSNTENIINLQVQGGKQLQQANHNGIIYYNQELLRQAQRRKIQKRRISELRKHFTSEEKGKGKLLKKSDPEQKIVEWLDKINMMKQLERKKILGLG